MWEKKAIGIGLMLSIGRYPELRGIKLDWLIPLSLFLILFRPALVRLTPGFHGICTEQPPTKQVTFKPFTSKINYLRSIVLEANYLITGGRLLVTV